MGFQTLVNATQLSAVYEPMTQTLYLLAEGKAQNYLSGIAFHPDDTFEEGLKFNLMGCVGPFSKGSRHYQIDHPFKTPKAPSEVVIGDASGLQVVPVRCLGSDVVRAAQVQMPAADHLRAL
ncbi:hypothetical protein D7V97_09445 [Corallococcus sp. CA053C]|uniref:hypothetical protein n=1 Tax=Corallococcus sp. CA053C TaxID=2316732 RepID=UPI000EA0A11F|nr:hypothetical protein [Corallococcus sp. CA053C]RKH12087.1 hypothetical protein D7V97_09445 [Corallococcus sp. CA053C]